MYLLKSVTIIGLIIILAGFCTQAMGAAGAPDLGPGTLAHASVLNISNQSESLSVIDILPLIAKENETLSMPSVAFFQLREGETFSPDAVRPADEVLYILSGSAGISADDLIIQAKTGDAVLVPAGSIMQVTNSGTKPVSFISIQSRESAMKNPDQKLVIRSAENTPSLTFGNETGSDLFYLYRLISPYEDPFNTSFDLALVTLPAGQMIKPHCVESGQFGYIITGNGNISVECVTQVVTGGDLVYIPPNATRQYTAEKEMHIALVTDPYYTPDKEKPASMNCLSE